jgi:hypothetical protein
MRNDDIQRIRALVLASALLSQNEKSEWLQFLPEMSDFQMQELESILMTAKNKKGEPIIPSLKSWQDAPGYLNLSSDKRQLTPHPVDKKQVIAQSAGWRMPDLQEKDLNSGIIAEEFELPAMKPQVGPKAGPVVHSTVPAWQQQLRTEKSGPSNNLPISSVITQAAIVDEDKASKNTPVIKSMGGAPGSAVKPSFEVNIPEDLAKIDLKYLRSGAGPQAVLVNLLKKITVFNQKFKFTAILGQVEKSPLYKSYYDLGFSLLNDDNPDRDAVWAKYQKNISLQGQSAMTLEEFEAFTDFRKSLERILI